MAEIVDRRYYLLVKYAKLRLASDHYAALASFDIRQRSDIYAFLSQTGTRQDDVFGPAGVEFIKNMPKVILHKVE